jgi:hypothetical protein
MDSAAGAAATVTTQTVEREREALASHMVTLTHLQNAAVIADHEIAPSRITHDNEGEFDSSDDLDPAEDDIPVASRPSNRPAHTHAIPVEEQQIYLPSNGNFADVEIDLRKNQASRLLHQLRELIADKSFQYSHIIRAAPRKGVRTRAQAVVQQLVNKITLHARMYNHCRSRSLALDCDAKTLSMFQQLTKDDLHASTAILKPNVPGSTTLHLSWIWHNAHIRTGVLADENIGADADAGRLWECKCLSLRFISIALMFFIVRCVHWLRSQAQRNRWREEFLLVTYEMQWTVRYFLYDSQRWQSASRSENILPGPLAYANRQQALWHQLALRADKAFRSTNVDYISPL